MEEIVKFLKEAETYYLATVEDDQPRVRPFGTAHIFEGKESYPTDIRDVRKVLSIDELMDELRKFDDEKLYPYVVRLIEKLKIAVSPSPMII